MTLRPRSQREVSGDAWRRQLAAREQRRVREIRARWIASRRDVDRRLAELEERMAAARAAGEQISVSWLYTEARLEELQRQIAAQVARFDEDLAVVVRGGKAETAALGVASSQQLTAVGLGAAQGGVSISAVWVAVDPAAVEALSASLTTGSPLHNLLGSAARTTADRAADVLIQGVVRGENPRSVVGALRRELDVPRWRAERIARTEMIGAYRQATTLSFQANRDVVDGWVWQCSLAGACGACLAMHGSVHDASEDLASHPHCKCSQLPLTKSWADLGFEGIDEIDGLDPGLMVADAQAEVAGRSLDDLAARFGPGKASALADGTIQLPDLVAERFDPVWGRSRSEASLGAAVRNASLRGT